MQPLTSYYSSHMRAMSVTIFTAIGVVNRIKAMECSGLSCDWVNELFMGSPDASVKNVSVHASTCHTCGRGSTTQVRTVNDSHCMLLGCKVKTQTKYILPLLDKICLSAEETHTLCRTQKSAHHCRCSDK